MFPGSTALGGDKKAVRTPLPIAVLAIAAACLAGCRFPSLPPAEVTCVVVPPRPHPAVAAYGEGASVAWTLLWIDEDGRERTLEHVRGETRLRLSGERVTPILMREETVLPGFAWGEVPPAGALFPLDAREGKPLARLYPDRAGGICASIAVKTVSSARGGRREGKRIADSFNWGRLKDLLGSLPRPHRVDRDALAALILSGSFTSRSVREEEVYSRRILLAAEMAEESPFIGFDPGEDPLVPAEDSSLFANLREGHNRLFGKSGCLVIQTSSGNVDCTFFRSYASMDP